MTPQMRHQYCMQNLELSLEHFGLHKNQVTVYLLLLKLGEATIQEITLKSKVKRTSVYKALDNLILRGLVTYQTKDKHRVYVAENPKKALMAVKEEQQAALKKEQHLTSLLPELSSLYNAIPSKPKVKFFEGIDGLKQIYEETLLLKSGSEILSITPAELLYKMFDETWIAEYLARRIQNNIHVRTIAEDSEEAKKHQANNQKELRESFLVSKDKFTFKNEINIFENKVAIISLQEQLGILIESNGVAETQRAFFELAWIGVKYIK